MEQRNKKNIKIDWQDIVKEDEFASNQDYLILLMSLEEEYKEALAIISNERYTMYRFFGLRFIKTYAPDYKDNYNKETVNSIKASIEEKGGEKYDEFERREKRRLENMLKALIGEEEHRKLFKNTETQPKFNIHDYNFFTFLLDSYSTKDAKNLRGEKYNCVCKSYLHKCEQGISTLIKYHTTDLNETEIVAKWRIVTGIYKDKLSNEVKELNSTINKIFESNLDYSSMEEILKYSQKSVKSLNNRILAKINSSAHES